MDMNKFSLAKHDPRIQELIKETEHKTLAIWAIDCFNRGRYLFNKEYQENEIIDKALDTLKLWINDEITMWEARKYCWVVLKAAREIEPKDKVACQILRACSHTLATCHVKTHSEGAAMYVISAIKIFYKDKENVIVLMEDEREWQINHLLELKEKEKLVEEIHMKKYTISNEDLEQGNKFNGNLFLENSQIKFIGKNNVLYIDGDVKLVNSSFEFRGDNSIVYICGTQDTITLDVKIYNNSVFYVGKEIWINKGIKIVISEQTNVFFGNDCLISYDTCIRTGDPHLVYDCKNHERINHSKSLYVGDHVWIGQNVMLLKGTKIGSGSIIGAMSLVTGKLYKSNCIYGGNPVKKIKEDVFFIKEDCHRFLESDTINNNAYDSDEFIYINNNKKLLFDEIEEKLKVLNVDEKIKYLNEITSNCDNNRFAI